MSRILLLFVKNAKANHLLYYRHTNTFVQNDKVRKSQFIVLKVWYNVGQSWIGCRVCLHLLTLYSTCTFVNMETVEEEEERVDEGME